ncbi:glycine oxidase ThiO [Virgibacillus necropolis]|uniref:glycine oxidase ThiO n=1 Tax=Virgibacillus necropolis TaxID=163877 RepID=UPI00384D8549
MTERFDVIIVGGGVIGSSIAFQLSKRNYKVLIVEKDKLAGRASSAAAGMLGAQSELENNSPLFEVARQSRAMFPALADELKELTGIDIELMQNGILKVAMTNEECTHIKSISAFQQAVGEKAEWLSSEQVKEKEPSISDSVLGGMFMPNDGQVSAPKLSIAFAQAATVLGAQIFEYTEVCNFLIEKGHVIGVETVNGKLYADETIVAGGAWSTQIMKHTGMKLDVYPVKGECFSVRFKGRLLKSSIFSSMGYIVPKAGGRLIIGATQKPYTFDEAVHLGSVSHLVNNAKKIISSLKDAEWDKVWAGIRPQTEDGMPYLDKHPHVNGLSIATGHYRNGILLSAYTGLHMADLLEGKEVNTNFCLDRKTIKGVHA